MSKQTSGETSRRANGEGSLYLGKDGKWHGWVTVGVRRDGTPDRRHVERATKPAALERMREIRRQADSRRLPEAGPLTVERWLRYWLEHVARPKLEPNTMASYRSKMRLYVIPAIGAVQMARLTAEDVEDRVYAPMRYELGLSETTVTQTHRILSRALTVAAKRRRIPRNPLQDLEDAPTPEPPETEVLTLAEVRRVFETLSDRRNSTRWHLALALGLRQSEALGLEWDGIDLERRTLVVRQDLERRTWQHGCVPSGEDPAGGCARKRGADCPTRHSGGLVLSMRTKSHRQRSMSIPAELVPMLREHRKRQAEEQLRSAPAMDHNIVRDERRTLRTTAHNLVFASETGRPIDPRRDWTEWQAILAEAGVPPVSVHDARHTAATMMLLHGVPLEVIATVLGHSQLQVTRRYAHVVDELLRDASSRIGAAYYGPASGTTRATTATETATVAPPRRTRR